MLKKKGTGAGKSKSRGVGRGKPPEFMHEIAEKSLAARKAKRKARDEGELDPADPSFYKQDTLQRFDRFVDAYFAHGLNGTKAAVAAGYSEKYAGECAYRVKNTPYVRAKIAERLKEESEKNQLVVEEVRASLARALRLDVRNLFGPDGFLLPAQDMGEEALELESVEVEEVLPTAAELTIAEERKKRGLPALKKVRVARTVRVGLPKKHAAREQAMRYFGMFARDKGLEGAADPMELAARLRELAAAMEGATHGPRAGAAAPALDPAAQPPEG